MLSERARTFLQERHFGVLATVNADGTPQLTTMRYLLENDTITMNAMVGCLKERNIRRNPYIALCVQQGYQYVTIRGNVEIIDDPEKRDIFRLALRYDGVESAIQQMRERFSKERRVTLCLKCDIVHEYFSQ